jgi:hypothetical protein
VHQLPNPLNVLQPTPQQRKKANDKLGVCWCCTMADCTGVPAGGNDHVIEAVGSATGEVSALVGALSAPQSPEDRLVTTSRLLELLSAAGSGSELIGVLFVHDSLPCSMQLLFISCTSLPNSHVRAR